VRLSIERLVVVVDVINMMNDIFRTTTDVPQRLITELSGWLTLVYDLMMARRCSWPSLIFLMISTNNSRNIMFWFIKLTMSRIQWAEMCHNAVRMVPYSGKFLHGAKFRIFRG
jgi:hypothetical protein